MNKQFFIKKILLDSNKKGFSKIILENPDNGSCKEWEVSEDLMNFSLENDLCIKEDPQAQVLVYTARKEDGIIGHTIKVFYKGNQENLLYNPDYTYKFLQ